MNEERKTALIYRRKRYHDEIIEDKEERLRNAVLEIKRRLSEGLAPDYRAVADEFNVKPTTLFDRAKKGIIVHGKVLTSREEKGIVQFVEKRQKGAPLTKPILLELINQYLRVTKTKKKINFSHFSSLN